MSNTYCEYCGKAFASARMLTSSKCAKHPDGTFKGLHKLYEGSEKKQYTCKYCGKPFPSLQPLVSNKCTKHPAGTFGGFHSPAL